MTTDIQDLFSFILESLGFEIKPSGPTRFIYPASAKRFDLVGVSKQLSSRKIASVIKSYYQDKGYKVREFNDGYHGFFSHKVWLQLMDGSESEKFEIVIDVPYWITSKHHVIQTGLRIQDNHSDLNHEDPISRWRLVNDWSPQRETALQWFGKLLKQKIA